MRAVLTSVVALAGPFLLSGCGSDGSTTPSPTSSPSTSPSPPPAPVSNSTTPVRKTTTQVTTSTTTTTTTTTVDLSDLWACSSSRTLPNGIVAPEKKGMAVDDTSMSGCSDKLTGVWPHDSAPVTSFRLFAAWKPEWDESRREESWQTLKQYVQSTNARILLGTEVTHNQQADDQMWGWAKDLMQLLGKEHIMGVSVGNEMDNDNSAPWDFWSHGFFDMIQSRLNDMDAMGFTETPITVVWSMGALPGQGSPPEQIWNNKIAGFLTQARDTWGSRWVWAFNPYPIWDKNLLPSSQGDCQGLTEAATSLDYTRNVMGTARDKVASFVGSDDYTLWVTESGWSAPGVNIADQQAAVAVCPLWADKETLWNFYKTMMEWDLSLPSGDHGVDHGVDHFFYFTMRDAGNHGMGEGFGLISSCDDTACKLDAPAEFLTVV